MKNKINKLFNKRINELTLFYEEAERINQYTRMGSLSGGKYELEEMKEEINKLFAKEVQDE